MPLNTDPGVIPTLLRVPLVSVINRVTLESDFDLNENNNRTD